MRKAAVLALLLLMLASGSAARCYPPGTRVVVFVQGLYTSFDGPAGETMFDPMKKAFVQAGYDPAQLLDYSYAGGSFSPDGAWQPNGYGCATTDQPVSASIGHLEALLRDYRARHEHAHFTLVGHSLGGYIAYLAAVADAARPPEQRLQIEAVVTLDAPLMGLDADKKLAIDLIACEKTYAAGASVVADGLDPQLAERRTAEVAALRAAEIRLATLGNLKDCLFDPVTCAGAVLEAETESQLLPGADLAKMYDINARLVMTHFIILRFATAIQDVVTFTGAP
jgi:pimeloyl-ACP methyl ester carboxylesterase